VDLVQLLNICLQFEISDDEIKTVQAGMIKWVEEYEWYEFYLVEWAIASHGMYESALVFIMEKLVHSGLCAICE
jgi:hypothetical protein